VIRVLHIISGLNRAGGTRSACAHAAAATAASNGLGRIENRMVSLLPAEPGGLAIARQAGLDVLDAPDRATLLAAVAAADIVHLHWWNTPVMYQWLTAELPPMRLLVFVHVAGDVPPNILTRELVDFADVCVAGCAYVLGCPALRGLPAEERERKVAVVPATADFSRLAPLSGVERVPQNGGFRVGYVGTADFQKMHPDFVAMSGAVRVPGIRFIVCGRGPAGLLEGQARALGIADRFDVRGHVDDLAPVLGSLDVFGYPLSANPGAELSVQEAMYAGVPPVVFPLGGLRDLVTHGVTGLVADGPEEYARAIERLYADPAERRRLGANARDFVRRELGGENAARRLLPVYRALLDQPKRQRSWPGTRPGEPLTGAALFVQTLGEAGEPFRTSLLGGDSDRMLAAERRIAAAPRLMVWGLGLYCDAYPEDAHLRRWLGLLRAGLGEREKAEAVR
jgi:glycosyltransferase involved in cell wall biosynthesis